MFSKTEAAILEALSGSRPLTGIEIAHAIKKEGDGAIAPGIGALYPALRALEKSKLLESFWGIETQDELEDRGGVRKRYYRLTGPGRTALSDWRSQRAIGGEMIPGMA